MFTLGELAGRLGLEVSGDEHRTLTALAPLSGAGPSDLSFCSDRTHLCDLRTTRAGAVIVGLQHVDDCPVDSLIAGNPYLAFARASALFDTRPRPESGVHPSASVAATASIAGDACVGARAVIEEGVTLGAGAIIGAGVYVGHDSKIGSGTCVRANAVIHDNVSIGADCIIHGLAVLGGDGFGFAAGPDGWEKIHQLGGLVIGDGVEIGSGTTVDRGALADTVIADGVIIDNQVQVAHNCKIGKNSAIAACCGLAGGTIIGANCTLAGGVGVVGHVEICDEVHITGMTMVTRSITQPGSYSSGTRMAPTADWKRSAVRFSQLESMQQRLAALERRKR